MKTHYTHPDMQRFLEKRMAIIPGSIVNLVEGETSQVVSFSRSDGKKLVLRIREHQKDLLADKYAHDQFGRSMPIPEFLDIGQFGSDTYYCITAFADGVTAKSLSPNELADVLPVIQDVLAKIYTIDIMSSQGYGYIEVTSANAPDPSWKESLIRERDLLGLDELSVHATTIGLPNNTINRLNAQLMDNLPFVSEVRRLLHGDPGHDNLLILDGNVNAVIDWEQMAYGDWVRDFSRFESGGHAEYGDITEFGIKYGLETENITERIAVYSAIRTMRDIEFAGSQNNARVAAWVRSTIEKRIR